VVEEKPTDQKLFDEPFSFEFFQAVRLLEKVFPDRKAVGRDALPHEEIIRFRSRIGLDFPASEIQEFRERDGKEAASPSHEMFINFMGMVGVSGALPRPYSDLVLDRSRYRDTALWSFLDIFTHRLVSLFYRAWSKYRFPIDYERGNDAFTTFLFDFAGLGTSGLLGRMDLEDESLLPYTGLIVQKPHSVNAIENIIEDYFEITAEVEQFFGQWLDLDQNDLTEVGRKNHRLGSSTIVGTRVWDQQSKFRVRLGPLKLDKFIGFLPNGTAHKTLGSIIRFLTGMEFDFDVRLCLEKRQVPGTVLTTRAMRRPMLGWTSFLKTLPAKKHDDQLVLEFSA
jgi:type VI secretion system protein ImpH